jgi:VanZ family protein
MLRRPDSGGGHGLAWRPLWLAAGWLMVALVVFLSLTPTPPDTGISHGDKLAHFAAYAGLMAWFSELYAGRSRRVCAAGFVALGVCLEFAQGYSGIRSFDVLDMLAGGAGVSCAWLAYLPVNVGVLPRAESVLYRWATALPGSSFRRHRKR